MHSTQVPPSGDPPSPSTPARTRTQFRISWWAGLVVLVLVVLAVVGAVRAGGSAYAVGREAGGVLGTMLIAALVGVIAFYVARRSALVFNIAFACMVGMAVVAKGFLLTQTPSASHVRQQHENIAQLREHTKAMGQDSMARYEQGEVLDAQEQAAKAAKLLEDAKAKSTDPQERAFMDLMGKVALELGSAAKPYTDALKVFADAGGINPATISEVPHLEARLAMVDELSRTNDECEQAMRRLIDGFRARLDGIGMPAGEAATTERGLRERMAVQLRLRANQRSLVEEMRGVLVVLRDHWDDWGFAEGQEEVSFSSEETLAKYNARIQRIGQLSQEEESIMREITTPRTR